MNTQDYFNALSAAASSAPIDAIEVAIKMISETIESDGCIYTCGNGGSALTASHYVTDWGKMRWINRGLPFRAFCLSDNVGMLTAYSNDLSYSSCFSESIGNYGRPGDLIILVSGSGNSPNVIKAAEEAKQRGISTLCVVGFDGGSLAKVCDHSVHFRVNDMQIVEDLHLSFGHIVMKRLCDE